jgi:uncharacterized membrane protein YoaK (UPF0700 family)
LAVVLIALTAFAGLVDAASYLGLGHVFVANMTGNVIFIGFGVGGVRSLDLAASLVALGAFLAGAAGGGRLTVALTARGRPWLAASTGTQTVCVAAAASLLATGVAHVHGTSRLAVVALLAAAMGVQNALARRLNIPDLTTTVLTQTLTRLATESRIAGSRGAGARRRVAAVTAMLIGALIGAVLVLGDGLTPTLFAGAALLATVTVISGVRQGPEMPRQEGMNR